MSGPGNTPASGLFFLRRSLTFRGRKWWRGRLWCPGCYGKYWLWRTVSRCDGQTLLEYALILALISLALVTCLLFLKDRL